MPRPGGGVNGFGWQRRSAPDFGACSTFWTSHRSDFTTRITPGYCRLWKSCGISEIRLSSSSTMKRRFDAPIMSSISDPGLERKSTRLNSSHSQISYAVFCLKKKKKKTQEIDV